MASGRVAAMAWIVLPSMRCIPPRRGKSDRGFAVADQPAPSRPAHEIVVPARGFEPRTLGLKGRCSA